MQDYLEGYNQFTSTAHSELKGDLISEIFYDIDWLPCYLPSIITQGIPFLDPANTYTVNPYQIACRRVDILLHINRIEVYF